MPPSNAAPAVSWSGRYPSEDEAAETLLHFQIRSLLHLLVQVWLAERGERAVVLSDQFVYWVEGDERVNLAPDLLVIPGEDPERPVTSWKTWEEANEPRFALEVVSEDIDEDYLAGPPKFEELGVEELVLYDPLVPAKGRTRRIRWQVYRRVDGAWAKVEASSADRVYSSVLGCWLVEVATSGGKRARLAVGPSGGELVPTPAEAARAAAAEAGQRAEALAAEVERLRAALRSAEGR